MLRYRGISSNVIDLLKIYSTTMYDVTVSYHVFQHKKWCFTSCKSSSSIGILCHPLHSAFVKSLRIWCIIDCIKNIWTPLVRITLLNIANGNFPIGSADSSIFSGTKTFLSYWFLLLPVCIKLSRIPSPASSMTWKAGRNCSYMFMVGPSWELLFDSVLSDYHLDQSCV